MASVQKAQHAASQIFEIIDEKSAIDARNSEGVTKVTAGTITFKNVNFVYPSKS
jgi:ABC-type multidrug transport system fused ATPase/permease subunit